ncbi:MAG: TolC family protein [Saprospiraceae bacterium]|nr:TolC family protein [Saprospiraceae bacterium]
MKIFGFWLLVCICMPTLKSQSTSENILSLDDVFNMIKIHHPLTKVADLQLVKADAELLKSKGFFDPKISTNLHQKYFDSKNYYSLFDGNITIPTWIGADVKTGYEMNRGVFLGPENATPSNGLFYAGVSFPLGQGLFIDERRAAVKGAGINQDISKMLRIGLMNDLLFDAANKYWDWFKAYNIQLIFESSLQNANQRYLAVKINAASGDRPPIDTVEAKIQLQNIALGLNQARISFKNSSLMISTLFWSNNNDHIGLNVDSKPYDFKTEITANLQNISLMNQSDFMANQPYLRQLDLKLDQLALDKRVKQDKLKPFVNLQYNPINEPINGNPFTNYSINNYKLGLEFKMPLFLRKERGDIKIADIKIKETSLELKNKAIELSNKYQAYYNEWLANLEQVNIYQETVELYEKMYNAEKRLFDIGESSLFLVNSREQSFINAKIKLIELIAKSRMSYYTIFFYSGKLMDI